MWILLYAQANAVSMCHHYLYTPYSQMEGKRENWCLAMKARRWRINKNCRDMKTFSELAECLARIPPKITLYGRLFKYSYVGCLQLLMFITDLLFAVKRDAYIFKETVWQTKTKHNFIETSITSSFQFSFFPSRLELFCSMADVSCI